MMLRRDTRYKEFCYENCTKWLHQVFSDSCIFVIKPSRMHLHTFACYEHFLETNEVGMPNYKTDDEPNAWLHLRAVLQSCTTKCEHIFSIRPFNYHRFYQKNLRIILKYKHILIILIKDTLITLTFAVSGIFAVFAKLNLILLN